MAELPTIGEDLSKQRMVAKAREEIAEQFTRWFQDRKLTFGDPIQIENLKAWRQALTHLDTAEQCDYPEAREVVLSAFGMIPRSSPAPAAGQHREPDRGSREPDVLDMIETFRARFRAGVPTDHPIDEDDDEEDR